VVRRRRLILAAVAVVVVVVAIALVIRSCAGGDGEASAPAMGTATAVPAGALVYLHVSTDSDRAAVTGALDLARRFPSLGPLRDRLLRGLATGADRFDYARDVDPWLGDDVALAVVADAGQSASSLIVAAVDDRARARAFLRRTAGRAKRVTHRGTSIDLYGDVATAFAGGYLVIGPSTAVRAGLDAQSGRRPALAAAPVFRRTTGRLPADRAADAYASGPGVRRLIAAQGGLLGVAGTLLDQPGLRGTAIGLSAEERGAQVSVRSDLAPGARTAPRSFSPELDADVPGDALAYFGTAGFDRTAARLLSAGAAGGLTGPALAAALTRLGRDLSTRSGSDVARDVVGPLKGEVALWLTPSVPAPVLTLIARTRDDAATRTALRRLHGSIITLLTPPDGSRSAPAFRSLRIAGEQAWSLQLAGGVRIVYAVFDGRLVISTSPEGVRAVKQRKGSLADSDTFTTAVGDNPGEVTSLLFLDFSQLLRLGEQTGLSDNRSYLAVRDDLRKVRAVGAVTSGDRTATSTELFLEIP
jgi:hypothetical protein